jgi:hypothetical protein
MILLDNVDVLLNIFLFMVIFGRQCVVKLKEMHLSIRNVLTISFKINVGV